MKFAFRDTMETREKLFTANDLKDLRDGIRATYAAYHRLDMDRFPDIDYNTNRANYEPLRRSFEEEFYRVRKLDRNTPGFHIPSTSTLATLFTDDSYVPGPKIVITCRQYANRPINLPSEEGERIVEQPKLAYKSRLRFPLLLITAITTIGLAAYYVVNHSTTQASDLIIDTPHHLQTVPRIINVKGRVKNAEIVWLVVHYFSSNRYVVHVPIPVSKTGTWEGLGIIGDPGEVYAGHTYELRTFVNPGGDYVQYQGTGQSVFDHWPEEYELATKPILLVRGADNTTK